MKKLFFLFVVMVGGITVSRAATGGLAPTPAGNNGEVQFNKSKVFGSDSTFTFSTTTKVLSVSTVAASQANISTITFSDGTSMTSAAAGAGDITSVTAGYGLTGGGVIGAVTLNLDPDTTSFIQTSTGTNGPGQLVRLDGDSKLPAVDGSQATFSTMTITGEMTVASGTVAGPFTIDNGISYLGSYTNKLKILYNACGTPGYCVDVIGYPSSATDGLRFYADSTDPYGFKVYPDGVRIGRMALSTGELKVTYAEGVEISTKVAITGSLTASGLIYPTSDAVGLMQSDGAGNLSLSQTVSSATITNLTATTITVSGATHGDMYYAETDGVLTRIPPPTSTEIKWLSGFGDGAGNFSGYGWQPPPNIGQFTYFMSSTTEGSNRLFFNYEPTAIASITVSAVSADVIISTWITPSGYPGVTSVPAGMWKFHFDASRAAAAGKSAYFYAKVYKYDGANYTLLLQTQNTENITILSASGNPQELDIEVSTAEITLASTDRLVEVVYAGVSGVGVDPTLGLWYQGETQSRMELPAAIVNVNNYVSISSANANLVSISSANANLVSISSANVYLLTQLSAAATYVQKLSIISVVVPISGASLAGTITNGGGPVATLETATNKVNIDYFPLNQTTTSYFEFSYSMPNGWDEGTVTFYAVWTATESTGGVAFNLQGLCSSNDDALDTAYGTAVAVTDTLITVGDVHTTAESSAITIGGTCAEGDYVTWRGYRDVANGSDTLDAKALLLELRIKFVRNSYTD